jgi:hypothetical protein
MRGFAFWANPAQFVGKNALYITTGKFRIINLGDANQSESVQKLSGTELEFVIMVIAVSCVKLLSAHNSTQHTSRKHKV